MWYDFTDVEDIAVVLRLLDKAALELSAKNNFIIFICKVTRSVNSFAVNLCEKHKK